MIKIAILDDHQMFVDGISRIIEEELEISLVAVCKTQEECNAILKNNDIDILLNDIKLEKEDGIAICAQIKQDFPKVKIIMLTMFNELSFVKQAFNSNADGYLLKSSGRDELLNAIRKVSDGETFVDAEIDLSEAQKDHENPNIRKPYPKLSKREKEVLKLILEEFTTSEIAAQLFVSPKTIESHRSNLHAKFNVRNIAGLVRKAIEQKIVM